jgi:hypothetical protein
VKQGGVLSPVLLCINIDDLLLPLSRSTAGCFIGNNFLGALAYADDIVLIAPTASALSLDQIARSDSTQLNSTQLASSVELNRIGRVITLPD